MLTGPPPKTGSRFPKSGADFLEMWFWTPKTPVQKFTKLVQKHQKMVQISMKMVQISMILGSLNKKRKQ